MALVVAVVVGASVAGIASRGRVVATPKAQAADTDVVGIQSLYAQDLVARINAERAARSSWAAPVPQLQVDPGLEAYAQAWSAHLAAMGTVADPPLPPCGGPTSQMCILASNAGASGYGAWPGDGSDEMDSLYMGSTVHRQNMLGADYTDVGVGVTCSANQAWTVEVFGYQYGTLGSAAVRAAFQNAVQGFPVPASPTVAGVLTGDPVYCPGQTVGPNGMVTATGGQYPYAAPAAPVVGEPITPPPVVGMAATPDGKGYWLVHYDGSISTFGDALNYGSMAGQHLNAPIAHIVATPDGKGYWLVAADGGIFNFGDAHFYGSMGGRHLNAPVVGLAPTPDGKGYWLVAADGGIFNFGDAHFYGSMGGWHLNQPVVGMAADPATGGYWMVASDGGVFSFDAPFYGSTGGIRLNQPVNGMAALADGGGYWFVASDGGVFTFGQAAFRGSTGAQSLNAPVVGMATDPATGGYWLAGSDGGVFSFDAPFFGAG